MTLSTDQKDGLAALGFIGTVALFIIFNNSDATGIWLGLGGLVTATALIFGW